MWVVLSQVPVDRIVEKEKIVEVEVPVVVEKPVLLLLNRPTRVLY
jgi:hypothetical protein